MILPQIAQRPESTAPERPATSRLSNAKMAKLIFMVGAVPEFMLPGPLSENKNRSYRNFGTRRFGDRRSDGAFQVEKFGVPGNQPFHALHFAHTRVSPAHTQGSSARRESSSACTDGPAAC